MQPAPGTYKRTCCKVVRIHFLDTLMLPGWASRERRIRSLAPLCPRTLWLHYALVEGLKPTAPLFTLTLCPLTFLLRWLSWELPTAVLFVCLPVSLFPSLSLSLSLYLPSYVRTYARTYFIINILCGGIWLLHVLDGVLVLLQQFLVRIRTYLDLER